MPPWSMVHVRYRKGKPTCWDLRAPAFYMYIDWVLSLFQNKMNVYYSTLTCACKKLINKTFINKLLYPNKKKKVAEWKPNLIVALFVSTMMFSRKWVIFQETFSIKLFHFSMFGSNLKWVEKQFPNFPYLACCEIKFFKKI